MRKICALLIVGLLARGQAVGRAGEIEVPVMVMEEPAPPAAGEPATPPAAAPTPSPAGEATTPPATTEKATPPAAAGGTTPPAAETTMPPAGPGVVVNPEEGILPSAIEEGGPACGCGGGWGWNRRFWDWVTYKPLERPGCIGCGCTHCGGNCFPPLYLYFLDNCKGRCCGPNGCCAVGSEPEHHGFLGRLLYIKR